MLIMDQSTLIISYVTDNILMYRLYLTKRNTLQHTMRLSALWIYTFIEIYVANDTLLFSTILQQIMSIFKWYTLERAAANLIMLLKQSVPSNLGGSTHQYNFNSSRWSKQKQIFSKLGIKVPRNSVSAVLISRTLDVVLSIIESALYSCDVRYFKNGVTYEHVNSYNIREI